MDRDTCVVSDFSSRYGEMFSFISKGGKWLLEVEMVQKSTMIFIVAVALEMVQLISSSINFYDFKRNDDDGRVSDG